jgi:pyruvate/2-oxoacid:ferredoxin oxidoreductase alpha subunit
MAALTAYAFISTAALIAAYPEITPATEVVENVEMPDYESFETIIKNGTI